MLSGQKIIENRLKVKDLTEHIHLRRDKILGIIFQEQVLLQQEEHLRQDLGGRYQREGVAATFVCPRCGGRKFTRKGKRKRKYKSVIGKTEVFIVQVKCCHCGHRFCPYKDEIGLTYKDRISPGLVQRQMDLTCQIPYGKSQNFTRRFLGVSVNPMTVRKAIDKEAEAIRERPVFAKDKVVYMDSTKVKAGSKERGEEIYLAITAIPGYDFQGRPRMSKRFLFLKTGSAEIIKESLKPLEAKGIVHDGDMDLTGCAKHIHRCFWHLPHQLWHFLWVDGLNLNARRPYVKELIETLYHTASIPEMRKRYVRLINGLREKKLLHSAVHLEKAEKEITTAKEYDFPYPTNSPVEREMREINRRSDVGVRWSVPGIENLLLVKTCNRFY